MADRTIRDCDRCGRKGIPREGRVFTGRDGDNPVDLCPGCAATLLSAMLARDGAAGVSSFIAAVVSHPKEPSRRTKGEGRPGA